MPDIPSRVRDYLDAFNVACVYVDGHRLVGPFPRERSVALARPCDLARLRQVPDDSIWWASAAHAEAIARVCEAERSTDIIGMAKRMHVQLTAHAVCIERARERVEAIEQALRKAKDAGQLKAFNRNYARYRQQQIAAGRGALPYFAAFLRLQQEIYRRAPH